LWTKSSTVPELVPVPIYVIVVRSSNQGEFQTELIVFVDKAQYEAGSSGANGMTVETALQAGLLTNTKQFILHMIYRYLFIFNAQYRYCTYFRNSNKNG
jgi:hypothetical protein